LFGALVEAQLKAQLRDSVRTWLVEHSATRAHLCWLLTSSAHALN
jgi:hypothetical protein